MSLSVLSILLGAAFTCAGMFGLFFPRAFEDRIRQFPRSLWPGRMLTAIGLPWAAYVQLITPPVAGHDLLTKLVLGSVPVAFFLIIVYLKELLSVRALGGILLLAATPLLKAARLHESPLSVCVTLMTYLLILVGIVWVLSPFRFRHWLDWVSSSPTAWKFASMAFTSLGGLFAVLGLFVY